MVVMEPWHLRRLMLPTPCHCMGKGKERSHRQKEGVGDNGLMDRGDREGAAVIDWSRGGHLCVQYLLWEFLGACLSLGWHLQSPSPVPMTVYAFGGGLPSGSRSGSSHTWAHLEPMGGRTIIPSPWHRYRAGSPKHVYLQRWQTVSACHDLSVASPGPLLKGLGARTPLLVSAR